MKKTVLIFFLAVMSSLGNSQNLTREILEYRDTTTLLIKNGRKLITKNLHEGNKEKAEEIYHFLLHEVQNEEYIAFYLPEQHLLSLNLGIYDKILFELKDFAVNNGQNPVIYPEEDLFYYHLQQFSRDRIPELKQEINASPLAQEEKEFLKLYLQYNLFSPEFKDISQEALNVYSNYFLNKYPDSSYANIVRRYIRNEWKVSNWGFGIEFFTGYGHFTDNLAEQFNHNIPFGISFDVAYKKFNLNFRDYISFSKLKQDLTFSGNHIWTEGNKASIIIGEIDLGYFIIDSDRLRVYPSIGIAGFDISPPIEEENKDESLEDVGFDFKLAYWYGATFDYKLGRGKRIISNGYRPEASDWILRIRAGYYDPTFSKEVSSSTGGMWSFTVGIAGFGRFVKRKK